jgi:hypothetical protein
MADGRVPATSLAVEDAEGIAYDTAAITKKRATNRHPPIAWRTSHRAELDSLPGGDKGPLGPIDRSGLVEEYGWHRSCSSPLVPPHEVPPDVDSIGQPLEMKSLSTERECLMHRQLGNLRRWRMTRIHAHELGGLRA